MVGLGRFELPTSPLSGVRSNQLSYRPLFRGEVYSPNRFRHLQAALPAASTPALASLAWDFCLRTALLSDCRRQPAKMVEDSGIEPLTS